MKALGKAQRLAILSQKECFRHCTDTLGMLYIPFFYLIAPFYYSLEIVYIIVIVINIIIIIIIIIIINIITVYYYYY